MMMALCADCLWEDVLRTPRPDALTHVDYLHSFGGTGYIRRDKSIFFVFRNECVISQFNCLPGNLSYFMVQKYLPAIPRPSW
jgi:hypothetical protein